MRRLWIQHVLPIVFCSIPIFAGALVAAAIPRDAMDFYLRHLRESPMDWIILGLGFVLFVAQTILGWQALHWRGDGFDERPDPWLSHLAQGAEWFPLLGLLGTVAAILQTFSKFPTTSQPNAGEIIRSYAPAITATGSGLFMALANILPTWLVTMGRDFILSLSGGSPSEPEA